MSMTANLTDKENDLLYFIALGVDEYGSGFLHDIQSEMGNAGIEWAKNDHAVAGVLGSLIGKGLVWSDLIRDGFLPDAYWVQISNR